MVAGSFVRPGTKQMVLGHLNRMMPVISTINTHFVRLINLDSQRCNKNFEIVEIKKKVISQVQSKW